MAVTNSQKFIGKNRAPRVQIEYDVELYGAEKKVNIPFVMGVMSDLSGKPSEPLPKVEDRKMLEINSENFDDRLKAIKPRVAFSVPNVIGGEGNIAVDMTFENMDDFSPAAVASKVDGLKQLLEARQQLANLLSYMDGKAGAEELLNKILEDPALLAALSKKAKEAEPKEAPTEAPADAPKSE
jgi:type VI secretion system protein ImpB